jgi:Na+-driven multidrug efflux pump
MLYVPGLIIILLFILPCWAIQLNAEEILLHFHQEKEVAEIAGEYIAYFMPALPVSITRELEMRNSLDSEFMTTPKS